jgi:hypothetical protein
VTGQDKEVRVFRSFQEADDADRAFDRSLTPKQRVVILLQLIAQHGPAQRLERVYKIVKFEDS